MIHESVWERKALAEKNPASCPGLPQFMRPSPSFFKCPKYPGDVETWSEEEEAPLIEMKKKQTGELQNVFEHLMLTHFC